MADEVLIAVFIDFENLALGVKDAERNTFRIDLVLKRLLEKGRIVVKRAYCDWSRYRANTRDFHAHGIQLVDIPQSKLSGKNSADIHMVVDALDLCYAKDHIDAFALLSGDSDFSPLVNKLKENNKRVIGCGVKSSTSNLLIDSCDEFIYYDDLVRSADNPPTPVRRRRGGNASSSAKAEATAAAPVAEKDRDKADKKQEAITKLVQIIRSLERDYDPVWGSMAKQAIRRVYPGFNEEYYGYSSFVALLEDAEAQDYIDLEYDEKRGNYMVRTQPE
ncbi:MAG TPA: NYN domain-containing protein [Myxococcota bacterium]|nr:NYN domain-containing protein [Myxococcota bacterium]